MKTYHKRDCEVQATQWFPGVVLTGVFEQFDTISGVQFSKNYAFLNGTGFRVNPGDYVIYRPGGAFSCLRREIFEDQYEPSPATEQS